VFGATSVDEEIYFKAGGNYIVDDPSSPPVTEDTVFWICSQTKLITHVRSTPPTIAFIRRLAHIPLFHTFL